MNRIRLTGLVGGLYLLLFFVYLFGPLLVMVATAFNSSSFPRISPWDCLTADWFVELFHDEKLLTGLGNSMIIGFGVVLVAVPIGLAAAMVLSQVGPRLRSVMYAMFIAPILMPGVVLGLSTLIFWDRLGTVFGADYNSLFYNGIFLTIIGQVTFISAYSMLVFLSRLQRFDPTLTEAALDLGATQTQAFFKILLPYMTPAVLSAAVLAFLASMENYNTTVFTIVADSTFTTVLAQKVRYGLNPSISAVAVTIVGITLLAAVLFESYNRYKKRQAQPAPAKPESTGFVRAITHPGFAAGSVILLAFAAVIWVNTYDSSICRAQVDAQKRAYQEEFNLQERPAEASPEATETPSAPAPKPNGSSIFAPGNLAPGTPETEPKSPSGGIFAPSNLAPAQ